MQRILDHTRASLAESFRTLARNARRQLVLYYATTCVLVTVVVVSAVFLAGLAAARQLDVRRGHIAQYVSAISVQLQGEASFLRRTALTIDYYLAADAAAGSVPGHTLITPPHQPDIAISPDGRYAVIVPSATRQALGGALARKIWQLQQIATATLATQSAFGLDHIAYIVDPGAAYAMVLAPSRIPDATLAALGAHTITQLLDSFANATSSTRKDRLAYPMWAGPVEDPLLRRPAMLAISPPAGPEGRHAALLISSIPATHFLGQLDRPADPATLLLLGRADSPVDASPPLTAAQTARILSKVDHVAGELLTLTDSGVVLVHPLGSGFGALVYALSYGTLVRSIGTELAVIGGVALILIACLLLATRYWDIHLLRKSHADAARALENETLNHVLVSATPVGLCIVRRHDEIILTANAVANALLQRRQGDRMPASILDALRSHVPGPSISPVGAITQITIPMATDPVHVPGNDAATAPSAHPGQFLSLTYASARYGDEDVIFCALQDVTAQHQLEVQLLAAREAAEGMMRARSNFFAAMSHEIRTPLNALLGNLELLSRSDRMQAQAPRLRTLQVASESLRRIVNDILDFSKIDAGEMKLVGESFRPLEDLESLAMSYAPLVAERPIRFYVHLSPTLDVVLHGDRTRISQIVGNLLGNAFKFTACGKITLSATMETDAEQQPVLVCRVSDSGIGMAPALVARVFHPFVQAEPGTSARYGGTGLGLSICARLVELMGGHIALESVEGVGSAFTVSVPLRASPEQASTLASDIARGSRVMVLCQEAESGAMLEAWLRRDGWQTQVFLQRDAAQAWLRGNRPHIMVVTGEYGLDTIAALRDMHSANVVWITRDGPEQPTLCDTGVFEVTAFDHAAILAAAIAALDSDAAMRSPAASILPSIAASNTDAIASATAPTAPTSPPSSRRTILVAEDNMLNQALIAEQLESLGWHAIVAGDGRQALAVLEQESSAIDAVLTDIHMPVMDGYALLDAIRSAHADVPVLAYSAVANDGQANNWKARGFADHVAKPASLQSLGTALDAIPSRSPHNSKSQNKVEPVMEVETSPVPASELARYRALLREHLRHDEPELADILLRRDVPLLKHWAHRSAGAFLIVCAQSLVDQCRAIELQCEQSPSEWTAELADSAGALLDAVRQFRTADADADDDIPTARMPV